MGALTNIIPFVGPFLKGGAFNPDGGPPGAPTAGLGQYGANPYSSPLQSFASNYKAPQSVTAPGNAYQSKDMTNAQLPQYDAMRARVNQQYSNTQSQAQDALDRQFAAAGGGPGNGAQAKQTENLATSIAQQKGQDLLGVNAEEAQTKTDLQNQQNQMAFQSGEAQRGMEFGANEFNAQMGQQGQQFQAGVLGQIAGLNTSWDAAQQQSANDQYNAQLNSFQAQHSGGLLGGGGFLGLGI